MRVRTSLDDVRLHDLRHSFASVGVAGGPSLPILGALFEQPHAMTTARYEHLSAAPLANEAVGSRMAHLIDADRAVAGPVVPSSMRNAHRVSQ
jgi:hypothetical protein